MPALGLRVCAGCSVFALVVLSWLPGQDLLRSAVLSHSEEHFAAYMISAFLVAMAVPRYRFVYVACFYLLLAAILEMGQNFAPGRDAEALTALISTSGAVAGEIIARLSTGSWRERYGFPPAITPAPGRSGANALPAWLVRRAKLVTCDVNVLRISGHLWAAPSRLQLLARRRNTEPLRSQEASDAGVARGS